MADLFAAAYNPDVLTCLANLSNDEVFTPPELANQVLDMLPNELWSDASATFLDPCCKSGVFLREIAKRLIVGLADQIPDLQERVDHIFQKQLFGIAITELTSLLSRRSLYCSKWPNGKYSVTRFESAEGNLRFRECQHTWVNGRCSFCGASKKELGDGREGLETHAYEFIHLKNPEELFNMKFDVIVGNPPYQLSDGGGNGSSATPIYQLFVQQAMRLSPRHLSMIIPARWYSGGKGLDSFRSEMLADKRLRKLVTYQDSRECFSGVDIAGGVCYFLWKRDEHGMCEVETHEAGFVSRETRSLDEYPIFVPSNTAVGIVRKVLNGQETTFDAVVRSRRPFGIGSDNPDENGELGYRWRGGLNRIRRSAVVSGNEMVDLWKVIVSKASAEHAGQSDKNGQRKILTVVETLPPDCVCSETYLVVDAFNDKQKALRLESYLRTKIVRFLIWQATPTQNISKSCFQFVPIQDFSKPWTDEELYAKYGLTDEEIAFIESMIKPMDLGDSNA